MTPDALLTADTPAVSAAAAVRLASKHYGLEASAKPLWAERDRNYRLDCADGRRFVLKVANDLERPEVLDFQARALEYIRGKDPGLPVPSVIPTLEGRAWVGAEGDDGRRHMVRLMSWLEGAVIDQAPPDAGLMGDIGVSLARLGLALKGFDHPASGHRLLWDLKYAAELVNLTRHIPDQQTRANVEQALDRFVTHVEPQLVQLRAQVIHADLNRANILVNGRDGQRVSGIIDFGDMVHTPLINDIAVCAAYFVRWEGDPFTELVPLLDGYHRVLPLEASEARIFCDLVMARLSTSITLQCWRASLYPDNADYLLMDGSPSRLRLVHLLRFPRESLVERTMRILELEK
ncbi:MAG: phosphotransferase [Xanthomonadales bacterium]|nr:phosphotransferase [Xanthomonadales bacterium]